MLETIKPQLYRLAPTLNRPANQKPPGELGEKRNERVEESKGTKRLAPLRVRRMPSTPPRPTLARLEKPRKKLSRKPQRGDVGTVPVRGMLPKSRAIIATKRAIMPNTALNQRTSGRWPLETLQHALYIWCRVQDDKTKALTDVGNEEIDGLALKTYKKVTTSVSLQDERRKNQRDEGLARAPVS